MTSENKPRAVYKLVRTDKPEDGTDVYVGSTCLSLKTRLQYHRGYAKVCNTKLYKRMSEVGIYNWRILPLVVCPCNQDDIRTLEKQWIELLKPDLNTFSPIDSKTTDAKKELDKKHYRDCIESKKFYCDICNKVFGKIHNLKVHFNSEKHKDKSFEQLIEGVQKMIQDGTFSEALENSKETTL